MRPIGKYIAIKEIKEEVKTESGLLLSREDVKDIRYKKAKVAEPGTEVDIIKSGDVIYYDSTAGYSMFIQDEQFTIIREQDVVVVL
jgi:co-chaperonin GroES (HSP10)|tara:strand:+ start:1002 stop:1259 length:258 start_codon:yes stop_codon:yes gene_type:complete